MDREFKASSKGMPPKDKVVSKFLGYNQYLQKIEKDNIIKVGHVPYFNF